jgi:crotonobetainyl-CoA:carnitine CoA-transferase CaiB-like acyl-CoA transferase
MPDSPPLPLCGIRVLDLSRLLPGPFCTLILSDLGADVIKVEDTGIGDYLRPMPPSYADLGGRFVALNRDKRSVSLDLKKAEGVQAFLRLAAKADVVVESFRPGVMEKLGVGWEALAKVNPRLVLLRISGYGQTGPYRERAGHDLNYLALAGVLGLMGVPEMPEVPGVQMADIAGGGLWGAVAVLGALLGRTADEGGRQIDLSMTDGVVPFLGPDLVSAWAGKRQPRRGAEILTGGNACYGVYRTSDGKFLSVGALEPKFWLTFCATIGRKGDAGEIIASPPEQARIRAEVQGVLGQKTRAEWEAIFAKVDCCVEPVLEPDELREHPLHRARQTFYALEDSQRGPLPQVRTPVGSSDGHRPPPRQGQHSREVLAEAGFADADIDALIAAMAVRQG